MSEEGPSAEVHDSAAATDGLHQERTEHQKTEEAVPHSRTEGQNTQMKKTNKRIEKKKKARISSTHLTHYEHANTLSDNTHTSFSLS